ncbi:hypothetical protein [Deinococcus yavapaiensis]|uniref:Uncharacterized protein n=1 Tax=Deinococcus yavapaiensis KR-236 TaxID=694435 RepID=A0A318SDB2_9DEIO|nr:hypothetical protein [Deinococcus yavapaiensis]PYE55384.1 hypothetical protein DES52_103217 [Deinococcus yavapaiensis KR-236]
MEREQSDTPSVSEGGRVYVLRVWREEERDAHHMTVREGTNGQRRVFDSVDDCIDHLYSEFMRF